MTLSKIIAGVMHWGNWGKQFDTAAYKNAITSCVEMGITSFDHADIYGDYSTEAEFGAALAELNKRQQVQIVTKCGIKMLSNNRPAHSIKSYDSSATHIISSVEQSLKNLKTDYIDVLLIHRPDILMQPSEIAMAFMKLKQSGKVREFGVSNFSITQLQLLKELYPIQYNQIEISPVKLTPFTDGILDYCMMNSITPMAWSVTKGGSIYENENIKAAAEQLAVKYATNVDAIVYAWLLQHPSGILPITGSSNMDRIKPAVDALQINMSREDWYVLYSAALGTRVP